MRGVTPHFLGLGHISVSGCLPITPSSTRAGLHQARVQTPSTPELYSILNLSYQSRCVSWSHRTLGHFYIGKKNEKEKQSTVRNVCWFVCTAEAVWWYAMPVDAKWWWPNLSPQRFLYSLQKRRDGSPVWDVADRRRDSLATVSILWVKVWRLMTTKQCAFILNNK